MVLGGEPDGRYDHAPEPTEEESGGLRPMVPAMGAAVGFAQDPDADRLAIIDETGAVHRRGVDAGARGLTATRAGEGAGGAQSLDLASDRRPGRSGMAARSFARRWARSTWSQRMLSKKALLGGEGNGGVIDPRVGLRAR